jgi:hypothetical protein
MTEQRTLTAQAKELMAAYDAISKQENAAKGSAKLLLTFELEAAVEQLKRLFLLGKLYD